MPAPGPDKPRCSAHRTNGEPCKLPPIRGGGVCHKHGGSAPQVRAAANLRLSASLDKLMAALLRIALDEKQPAVVRLVAIRDALDRAGMGAAKAVTVELKRFEENIEGLFVDTEELEERRAARTANQLPILDGEVVEDDER